MLLTRRQKNKAYSDLKSYDPGQGVIYISRNIQKYIESCGKTMKENTLVYQGVFHCE